MDEEENSFDSPEVVDQKRPAAGANFLAAGILCWAGFLFFIAGLLPGAGSNAFVMIVCMLCGAHVLKSAPIPSAARLHAVVGMTLWTLLVLGFFGMLLVLQLF